MRFAAVSFLVILLLQGACAFSLFNLREIQDARTALENKERALIGKRNNIAQLLEDMKEAAEQQIKMMKQFAKIKAEIDAAKEPQRENKKAIQKGI